MSFVKKVMELREYKDTVIIPTLVDLLKNFIKKYAINCFDEYAKRLIFRDKIDDNLTVSIIKNKLYLHSFIFNKEMVEDINIDFHEKIDKYDLEYLIKEINKEKISKLLVEVFTEVFDGAKIEYDREHTEAEKIYHIIYIKN
jgi:hypothetical protein